MEISSLNSLAEVGIGINLAFGSINAVRDFFINHVKNGVSDCSSAIKTCLLESKNNNASANALHLEDILDRFKEKTSKISLYMVWAAFISCLCPRSGYAFVSMLLLDRC